MTNSKALRDYVRQDAITTLKLFDAIASKISELKAEGDELAERYVPFRYEAGSIRLIPKAIYQRLHDLLTVRYSLEGRDVPEGSLPSFVGHFGVIFFAPAEEET